jgi:hypothetical protein
LTTQTQKERIKPMIEYSEEHNEVEANDAGFAAFILTVDS